MSEHPNDGSENADCDDAGYENAGYENAGYEEASADDYDKQTKLSPQPIPVKSGTGKSGTQKSGTQNSGTQRVEASNDGTVETMDLTRSMPVQLEAKLKKFTLLRKLGSGGFGTVWLAEDGQLGRKVAIKTPHPIAGEKAETFYKRVLREGRASAALQHPNIVGVYEVDEADGAPYIVCEFIDGITLSERLEFKRLPVTKAIELAIQIARGLAHAHSAGVIHRDLKPANILLNSTDVPHIGDFGIAKHEAVEETISSKGSVIGTPAYMSPEQAQGFSQDADARSDIYSMGVVLFEMVTGERPFRGNRRMLVHQVIHDDPPSLRKLEHSVPRDLDTVCLKCLEKDPARRYATCQELVEELERVRDGEPIVARPISRMERFYRVCLKHRAISGLAVALLATLLIGLGSVSWQWLRAEHFGRQQQIAREAADRLTVDLAKEVDHSRRLGYNSRVGLATEAWTNGNYIQLKQHLKLAHEARFEPDRRDFEWYLLADTFRPIERMHQHSEFVTDVAISPDQELLAAAGLRTIVVWNNANGKRRGVLKGHQGKIVSMSFSPDGRLLASIDEKGAVRLWDPYRCELARPQMLHPGGGSRLQFNHDSSLLGTAGRAGKILLWNCETGKKVSQVEVGNRTISDFAWMRAANRIVVGTEDASVSIHDTDNGKLIQKWSTGRHKVVAIAVRAKNDQIAASLFNGDLVFLQPGESDPVEQITSYGLKNTIAFMKSRPWLASVNFYGLVDFFDVEHMKMIKSHRTHDAFQVQASLDFSANEERLVIGSSDGTVKLFNVAQLLKHQSFLIGHEGPANMFQFSPNGKQLISVGDDGRVNLYHPQSGKLQREIFRHTAGLESIAISSDGSKRAFGSADGQVMIQESENKKSLLMLEAGNKAIRVMVFLPSGDELICSGADGGVRRLQLGEPSSKLLYTHSGVVRSALLTPDGKTLITAGTDGLIRFVSVDDWRVEREVDDAGSGVFSMAISRSGKQLAVGLQNGSVRIFDTITHQWQQELKIHSGPVQSVLFTLSENTIVSAGNDKAIVISDLELGEQKTRLSEHLKQVRCLAISPDGTALVSTDTGGDVRLWRAPRNTNPLERLEQSQ